MMVKQPSETHLAMIEAYLRNITLHVYTRCFDLNLPEKFISDARICECESQKMCTMEEMMLNLRQDC